MAVEKEKEGFAVLFIIFLFIPVDIIPYDIHWNLPIYIGSIWLEKEKDGFAGIGQGENVKAVKEWTWL